VLNSLSGFLGELKVSWSGFMEGVSIEVTVTEAREYVQL